MTTSNRFEDRLLAELRHVVAARPAPDVITRHERRRTRFVLAGAGVAAATAAVAIVATGSDVTPSASAAYAVQPRPDGSVSVSIRSLSDAAGLQSKLRAAGVPAVVDYAPDGNAGCVSPPSGPGVTTRGSASGGADGSGHASTDGPTITKGAKDNGAPSTTGPGPGTPGDPAKVTGSLRTGPDGARFTIDPGTIKPGEKLYITTSSGAINTLGMAIGQKAPGQGCGTAP